MDKRKLIDCIVLDTAEELTVELKLDGKSYLYRVGGGCKRIDIDMTCRKLQLVVRSFTREIEVSRVQLRYRIID